MEIEPPRAGVDAIASAICAAGRRSRSRSEESPNAVETIPVEEGGVDALMREAGWLEARLKHQRTLPRDATASMQRDVLERRR